MTSTAAGSENAAARMVDLKLEVVVIPVSDVDRAKASTATSDGGSTPTSRSTTGSASSSSRRPVRVLGPVRHQASRRQSPARPRACTWSSPTSRRRATNSSPAASTSATCSTPGRRARNSSRTTRAVGWADQRQTTPATRSLRHVQRPGRQRLAAAGGHHAAARPGRHRRTTFASAGRPGGRAAPCGGGPWRAREAHRRTARRELAGLVRRVHGGGTGRRGFADVTDHDASD